MVMSSTIGGKLVLYFERNVNDFTRKSIAVLAARTDRNDEYEVFKIGLTEIPPPLSVSVMNDAGFDPQAPWFIERENINRDFGYVGEDVSFNVFAQAEEITPVDETLIDAGQMTQIFYAAWAPTHTTSHTLDGLTWLPLDNLSDTASDFAGSLNAPDFGFHRLVGRYQNAQGIWVYCDQSPDDTFDLASTDTIDMRQALDVPTDHGGGRVGDALAFAPHFLGVNQHALIAGAPSADTEPNRLFSGTAIVYPFTETGVAADPLFRLDKHSNTSSYGYFARDITSAGNFFQAKTDGTTTEDLAIIAQYEDIPNANNRSGWTVNDNCPSGSSLNDAGALYVFPGRAFSEEELALDPITRDPALILYGLQAGAHLWRVAGGVDINNDAFDDLIISSRFVDNSDAVNNHCPSNNCGGYAVVFGHAPVEDEIHVSCEADETFYGKEGNERLGYDVAALGDVNNDGCDDFVVGARSEDLGVNNQGTVHVIFGWGGTGCPSEPLEVVLGAGFPSSNFGWSLDGGTDVTGDGIPDLVVGAPNTASEGNRVGAAYLISGAYIGSLFPQASSPHSETLPSFLPLGDTVHPVSRILGDNSGENLGHQVKLLPHLGGNGASGIAVGSQYSSSLGFDRSGAVLGFEFDSNAQALEQVPSFAVIGEASRPDSEMGASIETFHDETRSLIAIGASLMSAVSLDQGACFVIDASEF